MTTYLRPGDSGESFASGLSTGLVGTVTAKVKLDGGATLIAATTAGITEEAAGNYRATFTIPADTATSTTDTYSVYWDDGATVVRDDTLSIKVVDVLPADSAAPAILAVLNTLLDHAGDHADYTDDAKNDAIAVALAAVEREIGTTYYSTTATSTVYTEGGQKKLPLPVDAAVSAITSITDPDGDAVSADDYALRGRKLTLLTGWWPEGDYEIAYTYGAGDPPADVVRAIALVAADWLKDGPADDRGYVIADDSGVTRLVTAGVSGAAFSIPEVNQAIYRHRVPLVGGP